MIGRVRQIVAGAAAVVLLVGLVAWAFRAEAQAVAESVVSLFRIYAIDSPLDIIGGLETEPVRTGRVEAIDGGNVLVSHGVRTPSIGNPDGGVLLGTGAGAQFNPLKTGRIEAIDGGYVSVPGLDAGHVVTGRVTNMDGGSVALESGASTDDLDLAIGALPTCDSSRDTHWQGTILGDYQCIAALGRWFRYNPIATTLYFTGTEPGTFKGPVEGRRFFIDPPAPVAETFRCYSLTATVQAAGTCIGACAGLPVGQQIARLAVGQDIAGNLCYVDVPCTDPVESVRSPAVGACGADAGSTGVRTFFWIEPTATGCTENPVAAGRIVCNISDG